MAREIGSRLGHTTGSLWIARDYDVSPDGQRFLAIANIGNAGGAPPPQINVTLNWFEELKARVPSN